MSSLPGVSPDPSVSWAKVIDQNRCIGCHACTVACKQEHGISIGVTRTYVKQVEVGKFPNVRRHFQINRCNHCTDAPCVKICPTAAMHRRPDGIVDFNRDNCIGCKACIAACPYDAIYIDPNSHAAEKCNMCSHRIDRGFQPACVVVCPTQAIKVGNLKNPNSEVAGLVAKERVQVRKPEKKTQPNLFYLNASEYTINPTMAKTGPAFLYAQPQEATGQFDPPESAERNQTGTSGMGAAAVYGNPTKGPWDWRVSVYTWTKAVASGIFLVSAALGVAGLSLSNAVEATSAVVALIGLALTAVLLISDLANPARFIFALTKPQPRSMLVWGAYFITAYTGLLVLFLIALLANAEPLLQPLRWIGIFLAIGAGGYTALLFGQAKGRDLWQEPGLPLHMMAQVVVAGAAALTLVGYLLPTSGAVDAALRWILLGSIALHLALTLGQMVMPHATTEGALEARNMIKGEYAGFFWVAVILGAFIPLVLLAVATGLGGLTMIASVLALLGLALYEHAYVQAGQSVALS